MGVDACYVAHHEDFADKKVIAFAKYAVGCYNEHKEQYVVNAFKEETPVLLVYNTAEQLYEWWSSVIWKGQF